MTTIGTATLRLLGDTAQFQKELSGASAHWAQTGRQMEAAGKKLTVGLTLPLAVAGGAATKFAVDFQEGMANVASLIPGNIDRVTDLGESVKELSIITGKPLTDLADGLYNVVSAFGDTADSAKILEIVARAAVGGVAETADALSLVSGVTKAYGDTTAAAVQDVADLALLTVRLGETTFPELAAAMGNVTPLAKELNITQEELFGTMATFTGVTGKASVVSTQFRGTLQALLAPTESTKKLFKELGVESGKALVEQRGLQGAMDALTDAATRTGQPLQDFIGSIEGQTLALASAGGQSDVWGEKMAAMVDKSGAVDAAFGEQTEGINATGFALKQSANEIAVVGVELGQVLLPTIVAVTKGIAGLTSIFTALPSPIQKVVVGIAGLLAVLGPLLFVAGKLVTAWGLVSAAFPAVAAAVVGVSAPIWLGVAAFAAIVAAGIALWKNWDVVKEKAQQFTEAVTGFFGNMFDKIVGNSYVPDLMEAISEKFGGLDKLMVAPAEEATRAVSEAFESIVGPGGKVKGINYAVSIDATELYGAVIEATGSAAIAFDALSDKVPPTAELFLELQDELNETGGAVTDYRGMVQSARRAQVDLNAQLIQGRGVGERMTEQLETVGNEAVTMSAKGQAGIDRQTAALKANETMLRIHTAADETLAMATDQTAFKFENLQRSTAGIISDFSPLGMLAEVLGSALEALKPAFDALKAPLKILGVILASAIMPILKALFPVIKFLSIAASYVVEGFLWLAGITLKVTGWLQNAIGTFVFGLGKMLSKIPLIGGMFKPLKAAGKAMRDAGTAQMDAGQGMLDAIDDVRAGREEIRALEWPEEADQASQNEVTATEGTTAAVEGTTAAVTVVGDQLVDLAGGILDAVLSIRDLTIQGVDYLAVLAGPGASFSPSMAMISSSGPAAQLPGGVGEGGPGQVVTVGEGAVQINVHPGQDPRAAGIEAADGFMERVAGRHFNRTKRQLTGSGKIDREVTT